jgi:hypothetical protein
MADKDKTCAHPACACPAPKDSKYCSTYCEDAGSDEVEISCDCGHAACDDLKTASAD